MENAIDRRTVGSLWVCVLLVTVGPSVAAEEVGTREPGNRATCDTEDQKIAETLHGNVYAPGCEVSKVEFIPASPSSHATNFDRERVCFPDVTGGVRCLDAQAHLQSQEEDCRYHDHDNDDTPDEAHCPWDFTAEGHTDRWTEGGELKLYINGRLRDSCTWPHPSVMGGCAVSWHESVPWDDDDAVVLHPLDRVCWNDHLDPFFVAYGNETSRGPTAEPTVAGCWEWNGVEVHAPGG